MKDSFQQALLFVCIAGVALSPLHAQESKPGSIQKNGVPAVVPKSRGIGGPNVTKAGGPGTSLSGNYVLTVTVKESERPLGEVSVLTSSSNVKTEVNLDSSSTPQTLSFSGVLQEMEGGVFNWDYIIGFRVPVTMGSSVAPGSQLRTTNVEYQSFTSEGSVQIRIGRSYDLLKAGGRVYTAMITPATEG